ncbi:MAG: glycosyltransferase family 87 protein [Rhodococcus sp. (in: high G+C Gram-positive bacteria)]|uniref:glycosyltransferase family 87 protein n=1 Tax=Rhodococcus sp. TaxID=1831 RepID=UPI002AD679A8|nr:glycosyltransferase family 87 protein [Rhodococcus sp. (in: high G+C Gram-positive bacteria)]
MDLSVFRDAGVAFTSGLPLYSEDFPSSSGFRFIYSPFAAIVFAPMAWIDPLVLQVIWTSVNIALVWWILKVVLRQLSIPRPSLVAVALAGVALVLEPVRSNLGFGQVNIVLMALVVADCCGALPRRFRGIGIGIAAAIKITPAAFGLVLLVRRDLPSIARALGAFLVTVGIGFVFLPRDSVWFWATEFFRSERGGAHEFFRNQAVTGLLARLGADGVFKDAIWLLCVAAIIAAAAYAGHRFTRSGEPVLALGVVALASLLAAPIAVTHHWVYVIVLIPLGVAPQYRSWRPFIVAAVAVFTIGPYFVLKWTFPGGWAGEALQQVIGNAQLLTALALFASAVRVAATRQRSAPDAAPASVSLQDAEEAVPSPA